MSLLSTIADHLLYGTSKEWKARVTGSGLVMTRLVDGRRETRPCTSEEEREYVSAEAW